MVSDKIKEFPDIGSKLTAPTKKSLFERQKAEAEAKRQREEEETAAVYEDFVKSFDDANDLDDASSTTRSGARTGGFSLPGSGFGGPSKRHFTGLPAGAGGRGGGRGSGPGSLGPPPPLSRKRTLDGTPSSHRDSKLGILAFEDPNAPDDEKSTLQHSDDEDDKFGHSRAQERAIPKPTVYLSLLPPGTSPAVVKSILPLNLTVEAVKILPPSGPVNMERKSISAIVTLAKDTPAIEIDTAVSALQSKYLGWGYYLSISRHLSSAAVASGVIASVGLSSTSLPFGAKQIADGPIGGYARGLPPSRRGGFAPPTSFTTPPGGYSHAAPPVQVPVTPPSDLKQLKLIHKTVEALITHGPEFEALLMSRPSVRREEKWAWLWDSRSPGGVWYRWRIWDVLTGAQQRIKSGTGRNSDSLQHIFDGGAVWAAPERELPFEYTIGLDEFVSDSDYNSSDDEDSGDESRRRLQHLQGGAPPPDATLGNTDGDIAYLNPLQKAKFVHLLARLPSSSAKLRRGDVARVTAFAIQHAGEGAEEVVNLITSNVHLPFCLSSANPERKPLNMADDKASDAEDNDALKEKEDPSSAKLIALYLISDILSSSSTSGVRHAWRYRQLFEGALKRQHTFAHLGRLEKEMKWGKLRAEKWKRSVGAVLSLWEGWCVFPAAAQASFAEVFEKPPMTKQEQALSEQAEKAKGSEKKGAKWKTVDTRDREEAKGTDQGGGKMDVDVEEEDIDGEPMIDDEDVDGEPMDDVDGEPMVEEGEEMLAEQTLSEEGKDDVSLRSTADENASMDPTAALGRRKRPRAEDMFADSDGE